MKRNRWNARRAMPAGELFADDFQTAEEIFRKPSRNRSDHKLQQLCRQVQRTVSLTLATGCGDPLLQDLVVESVTPAPDASRLLVMVCTGSLSLPVAPGTDHSAARLGELLARLDRMRPLLRREVAAAITRKRAPELAFQVVGPREVQPMKTPGKMAPVHTWMCERLPADVSAAIDRLARTDDAVHVAVMPDVHLSHEVCVGSVLATRRLIYPNAVGGDIGCGMAAVAFDADAEVLNNERDAARMLTGLAAVVPAMRHATRDAAPPLDAEPETVALSDPRLETLRRRDGCIQLGTLGRGNHFLEFQADEENRLWLMVHSGSRAVGQAVRDFHLRSAVKSGTGLWYLDAQAAPGQAYLSDAEWARRYARANRRAMIAATIALAQKLLGIEAVRDSYFDCDHNHVRPEHHFGQNLWVHRKGAAPASEGESGIIPGSMGSESYHVQGRGCAEALCSSSHGAGRAMSRGEARQHIGLRDLARQLDGVWYDHRLSRSFCEEAPSAYKDVRQVMRAQRQLTRVVRRLRPVVCYKAG